MHWGYKAAILVQSLQKWILIPCIDGQRPCRSTLTISGGPGQTTTDTHILRKPCIFRVEEEHEGSMFFQNICNQLANYKVSHPRRE